MALYTPESYCGGQLKRKSAPDDDLWQNISSLQIAEKQNYTDYETIKLVNYRLNRHLAYQ